MEIPLYSVLQSTPFQNLQLQENCPVNSLCNDLLQQLFYPKYRCFVISTFLFHHFLSSLIKVIQQVITSGGIRLVKLCYNSCDLITAISCNMSDMEHVDGDDDMEEMNRNMSYYTSIPQTLLKVIASIIFLVFNDPR